MHSHKRKINVLIPVAFAQETRVTHHNKSGKQVLLFMFIYLLCMLNVF
jgi:hypothetical protein